MVERGWHRPRSDCMRKWTTMIRRGLSLHPLKPEGARQVAVNNRRAGATRSVHLRCAGDAGRSGAEIARGTGTGHNSGPGRCILPEVRGYACGHRVSHGPRGTNEQPGRERRVVADRGSLHKHRSSSRQSCWSAVIASKHTDRSEGVSGLASLGSIRAAGSGSVGV
jgi:hypothetical protein